jgi:SAM-dependent methyltransferase
MPRVDYDAIAHVYDERCRNYTVDARLLTFMRERGLSAARWLSVLDIGCGTGKQLAANREALPVARLVGVDRSAAMLRIARTRCPDACWVQADGAALPLAAETMHYATSQFSYPHIGQTRELLAEAHRVLVPGGRFLVTNIDPWSMPGWLLYRYFPEALARDRQDFVEAERLAVDMESAGFVDVAVSRDDRSHDQRLDAFATYVSARHRASQLMAISDEAYVRGLDRLREAIEAKPDHVERSEFVVVTISGDRAIG